MKLFSILRDSGLILKNLSDNAKKIIFFSSTFKLPYRMEGVVNPFSPVTQTFRSHCIRGFKEETANIVSTGL